MNFDLIIIQIRAVDTLLAELWHHVKDNLLCSGVTGPRQQNLITLMQMLFTNNSEANQISTPGHHQTLGGPRDFGPLMLAAHSAQFQREARNNINKS